jgi:type II secretory pathway pseudopilin PulG
MKKENIQNKIYEGFSLVEMLLTMIIIGFVFLLVSTVLSTLIKVSTISTAKTTVRSESEFILELIRRNVRNSNVGDVLIYSTSGRTYDGETIVESGDILGYDSPLDAGEEGNEIHFRPNGYSRWVCIGFFLDTDDPDVGYILKSSTDDMSSNHSICFDPDTSDYEKYTIQLNSEDVDVDSFRVKYIESTYENYMIIADISAEPVYWYEGSGKLFNREVNRQVVVSTEGLTW